MSYGFRDSPLKYELKVAYLNVFAYSEYVDWWIYDCFLGTVVLRTKILQKNKERQTSPDVRVRII